MQKVTAIFDIGRTNKKFFLFDSDFREVYREIVRLEDITDDDGYPSEDLKALEKWTKEVFHRVSGLPEFDIQTLNFSCHGASLVHIDEKGKVLTPLYNYMKPLNKKVSDAFYDEYGPENEISRITGSPKLGMLNTGMQLYWLKNSRPAIFGKIKHSLHLSQYLSFLFTGMPVSEYTSIGCHTLLWDYGKKDYHFWVYQEGIYDKMAPLVPAHKTMPVSFRGKTVQVGVGIHDSSAALVPYIRCLKRPFLLVSTGTWSISINPFNKNLLTVNEIKKECLFNMRIDGSPVKVSRLFLGEEYKLQIRTLAEYFQVSEDYHKKVKFNKSLFFAIKKEFVKMFKWHFIMDPDMPHESKISHDSFDRAYHQLMLELVLLQLKSTKSVWGNEPIEEVYLEGGFSDNEVYIQTLLYHLEDTKLSTSDSSLGPALGAALVVSKASLEPRFLKENYALREQTAFSLE